MSQAGNGNEAFEERWKSLEMRVFGYLLQMTGDHSLAEDLCQETALKLYQSRLLTEQLPIRCIEALSLRIAHNVAVENGTVVAG